MLYINCLVKTPILIYIGLNYDLHCMIKHFDFDSSDFECLG